MANHTRVENCAGTRRNRRENENRMVNFAPSLTMARDLEEPAAEQGRTARLKASFTALPYRRR
jgi:hypothetical protein